MAAATDKLQKVGRPGTATTLGGTGYTVGDASIIVGSTTNWPTDTGVSFAIDQVQIVNGLQVRIAGTYCEFVGVVGSGTTITSVQKVFGDDQDYPAGSLTRVYVPVASERENRIVEWGLVHADQAGHLLPDIIGNDQLNGAMIKNENFDTTGGEVGGASITWSPSLTNLSGGTLNYAKYKKMGKHYDWRFKYTLGATGGVTGDVRISLPASPMADYIAGVDSVGKVEFFRSGVIRVLGDAILDTSSRASLRYQFMDSTTGNGRIITGVTAATSPMTFASGDVILGHGRFEGV